MPPVIIVGGGPVGLISSILLSLQEIPNVLFERHPGTSIHPKACGLNQRTMEILRHIGVEDEVMRQSAPPETVSRTVWYTSLGAHGREIHSRNAILPQIRLEPILLNRGRELNPNGFKHSTDVISVTETSDKVVVTVQNKDGTREDWEADYVLGADGGRMMADQLGLAWEGEKDIFDMVSAHFHAPLSTIHPNPNAFISWFINPSLGGSIKSGYLYPLGPFPSDPDTEEWYFGCAMLPDDPQRFDTDAMVNRIRKTLELPDLEIELRSVSHWYVSSIVTEHFRSKGGKMFLIGDAAHRIPPWGALGMNTGVQDAFNLIWKLAFTLRGVWKDPNSLLDTYEGERRPIAKGVAYSSLFNLRSHGDAMDRAIGVSPNQSTEENQSAMKAFFSKEHPDYQRKQLDVQGAQTVLDGEFCALGTEMGWFYPSVDTKNEGKPLRHGGQIREDGEFDNIHYHPSTIPGHHLPHLWLQRGNITISTRDLLQPQHFLLLANSPVKWNFLEEFHIPYRLELIDSSNGWKVSEGAWKELFPAGENGAVLVRPDGIIACRGNPDDYELQFGL
ncbi:hypothetical protein N7509_002915 [Penicillium cosmopolitanum]|uniref:FAD-binding domain-containing protein n=1 Tax=Penicillium cosmopolitanum TaxID=1131564 RepID=A0A9X0BDR8_9EURO|nr:uncharacterized protein N7509_002915 [Penicillium cosmopolitanum]KAJ5409032.1 hypothetical protein N7509_002915 [Penicillium cosmopolitanum]